MNNSINNNVNFFIINNKNDSKNETYKNSIESYELQKTIAKFVKFEIDESNRRTPAKYGIRSIPSVLAFKNGELVEARSGLMDEDTGIDWIKELQNGNS